MRGVCIGCRVEVVPDGVLWVAADKNSLRDGEEGWDGETLPSLSLDVDDGGVGGNVNPTTKQTITRNWNFINWF